MHPFDWIIIGGYLVWVVYDGLKRSRNTDAVEGYFLAGRSLPWWAVGLSVMATQMSAITLVGTTGQGYTDGLRLVQMYFGLPLAMVILSVTLVPFLYRARVFTAYEYLERRFDRKTRALTSLIFLVSRGLAVGVIISAPAVVLSVVLGWNLTLTALAIGVPTTCYTMLGGVQAVAWADVKQMVVIVGGLLAVVAALVLGLPGGVGLGDAMHLAGATGRLTAIDFTPDLNQTYTFWSGLLGGLFLMLGYFGCDQSQVQRHLTADSVDAARRSLLMSAYWKIPLQALILLTGVLVFVFYLFQEPPMLFDAVEDAAVRSGSRAAEYSGLETEFAEAFAARRDAAGEMIAARRDGSAAVVAEARAAFAASQEQVGAVRDRAAGLVAEATGEEYTDVNYVFPDLHHHASADRAGGPVDRGHLRGGDVERRGRAGGALHHHRHRLLPAVPERRGDGPPLSAGVEAGDRAVGRGGHRLRGVRGQPRVADRGRQPGRILLLRVAPGGVRARRRFSPGDRRRRLPGAVRGHGVGGRGGERRRRVLPLEQRGRHRRGRARRTRRQLAPSGRMMRLPALSAGPAP